MYDISVNHGQGSDPESFGGICAAAAALWRGYVISSVVVDREGFIWVGASNGLHRLTPDFAPCPANGGTSTFVAGM
jgi:ligand-binding sensor domain-containing protein